MKSLNDMTLNERIKLYAEGDKQEVKAYRKRDRVDKREISGQMI